ncbi:uncharacterized protein [Nicotiana tomentosiformis]|uniref:uncharacterized protein n=1 Tax=Nicotiana tomentosiformis TaxID=4098 RepID=UPI00388C5DB7
MASKGKEKIKSKKKQQYVPIFSSMPNMSPPLPHPPYQHGGSSAAAAPPSFHGSQHVGSPAAASPSFHGSQHDVSLAAAPPGFHGSQHDGSSFVAASFSSPSSSSIPSISRLDIGGSRPATSSAASAPSSRRRQNLRGDVQFDSYNRLIIVPMMMGNVTTQFPPLILPSFQSTHLVVDSMKPFCHDPRNSWRQIPCNIRDQMWNQFKTKCTWHPPYQNAINSIFVKKVAQRIKDTMFAARNASKMPDWLRKDVWDKHLEKWNTTEWKADSEQLKANRASSKGGSLHTGGSISFVAHKLRLEKERGRDMSHAEIFKEMHKKKDGTREHWVETRASDTYED